MKSSGLTQAEKPAQREGNIGQVQEKDNESSLDTAHRSNPLLDSRFRIILYATGLSLCAFWMTDVACSWLMREMTDADPFMVSLVQLALQLPIMLALLPAGVLSDILDRVLLLLLAQVWMVSVTFLLIIIYGIGVLSPWLLLGTLILLGFGVAVRMPNVGALVSEIMPSSRLTAALAISMAVINGSRIIGPAIAGLIISVSGVAGILTLNIVLLAYATFWIYRMPRAAPRQARLTWSDFRGALVEGVSKGVKGVAQRQLLLIILVFAGAAAVVVALLPILFDKSSQYGLMYAMYGAGAMSGAALLTVPGLHGHLPVLLRMAIAVSGTAMMTLSLANRIETYAIALFFAGAAWIIVLNAAQVTAALRLENSERGRGLSMLYVAAVAGTALASPAWGWLAKAFSPSVSFAISALLAGALALIMVSYWRADLSEQKIRDGTLSVKE